MASPRLAAGLVVVASSLAIAYAGSPPRAPWVDDDYYLDVQDCTVDGLPNCAVCNGANNHCLTCDTGYELVDYRCVAKPPCNVVGCERCTLWDPDVCKTCIYENSGAVGDYYSPHDGICEPVTQCSNSEYQVVSPTPTRDRECEPCFLCGANTAEQGQIVCPPAKCNCNLTPNTFFKNSSTECYTWTSCGGTEYEAVAPSSAQDRECAPCEVCTDRGTGWEEVSACTSGSNAVCGCDSTHYRTYDVCNPCTVCANNGANWGESSACSGSSDAVCECNSGFYHDGAGNCAQHAAPCAAGQYESQAPTAHANRECTACTECNGADEVEAVSCSFNSDAVCVCNAGFYYNQSGACVALTACTASEYESTAPTGFSDRVCMPCTVCVAGEFESSACSSNADAQCVPCSAGFIDTDDSTAANSCTSCGSGVYQPNEGVVAASCAAYECAAGTIDHDYDATTPCSSCPFFPGGPVIPLGLLMTHLMGSASRGYGSGNGFTLLNEYQGRAGSDYGPWLGESASGNAGFGFIMYGTLFQTWSNDLQVIWPDNDKVGLEILGTGNSGTCDSSRCNAGWVDDDHDFTTACVQCTGDTNGLFVGVGAHGQCSDWECPAGSTDHDNNIQTACMFCQEGVYIPNSGSNGTCFNFQCPIGTTDHDYDPTTPCVACPAGHGLAPGASGPCYSYRCPPGWTDHDSDPATPCIDCRSAFDDNEGAFVPPGSFGSCLDEKFLCPAGTINYDDNIETPCTSIREDWCFMGYTTNAHFVDRKGLGVGACWGAHTGCPLGTTDHDRDPMTPCQTCPRGHYIPEWGNTGACERWACPTGTFDHDDDRSTPCIPCEAGTTDHDRDPATACIACPAGTGPPSRSAGPCANHACPLRCTDHDSDPSTPCMDCNADAFDWGVSSAELADQNAYFSQFSVYDALPVNLEGMVDDGNGRTGDCSQWMCSAGSWDHDGDVTTDCITTADLEASGTILFAARHGDTDASGTTHFFGREHGASNYAVYTQDGATATKLFDAPGVDADTQLHFGIGYFFYGADAGDGVGHELRYFTPGGSSASVRDLNAGGGDSNVEAIGFYDGVGFVVAYTGSGYFAFTLLVDPVGNLVAIQADDNDLGMQVTTIKVNMFEGDAVGLFMMGEVDGQAYVMTDLGNFNYPMAPANDDQIFYFTNYEIGFENSLEGAMFGALTMGSATVKVSIQGSLYSLFDYDTNHQLNDLKEMVSAKDSYNWNVWGQSVYGIATSTHADDRWGYNVFAVNHCYSKSYFDEVRFLNLAGTDMPHHLTPMEQGVVWVVGDDVVVAGAVHQRCNFLYAIYIKQIPDSAFANIMGASATMGRALVHYEDGGAGNGAKTAVVFEPIYMCGPGFTDHDDDQTTPCISCGAGYAVWNGPFSHFGYQNVGPCADNACPAGTVHYNEARYWPEECRRCQPGRYSPPGSSGRCGDFYCAAGTTDHDFDPATPCEPCPPGSWCTIGDYGHWKWKVCEAGTTDHDSDPATPCWPCDERKYAIANRGSVGPCVANELPQAVVIEPVDGGKSVLDVEPRAFMGSTSAEGLWDWLEIETTQAPPVLLNGKLYVHSNPDGNRCHGKEWYTWDGEHFEFSGLDIKLSRYDRGQSWQGSERELGSWHDDFRAAVDIGMSLHGLEANDDASRLAGMLPQFDCDEVGPTAKWMIDSEVIDAAAFNGYLYMSTQADNTGHSLDALGFELYRWSTDPADPMELVEDINDFVPGLLNEAGARDKLGAYLETYIPAGVGVIDDGARVSEPLRAYWENVWFGDMEYGDQMYQQMVKTLLHFGYGDQDNTFFDPVKHSSHPRNFVVHEGHNRLYFTATRGGAGNSATDDAVHRNKGRQLFYVDANNNVVQVTDDYGTHDNYGWPESLTMYWADVADEHGASNAGWAQTGYPTDRVGSYTDDNWGIETQYRARANEPFDKRWAQFTAAQDSLYYVQTNFGGAADGMWNRRRSFPDSVEFEVYKYDGTNAPVKVDLGVRFWGVRPWIAAVKDGILVSQNRLTGIYYYDGSSVTQVDSNYCSMREAIELNGVVYLNAQACYTGEVDAFGPGEEDGDYVDYDLRPQLTDVVRHNLDLLADFNSDFGDTSASSSGWRHYLDDFIYGDTKQKVYYLLAADNDEVLFHGNELYAWDGGANDNLRLIADMRSMWRRSTWNREPSSRRDSSNIHGLMVYQDMLVFGAVHQRDDIWKSVNIMGDSLWLMTSDERVFLAFESNVGEWYQTDWDLSRSVRQRNSARIRQVDQVQGAPIMQPTFYPPHDLVFWSRGVQSRNNVGEQMWTLRICPAGWTDDDSDASTPCVECGAGHFTGALAATGSCLSHQCAAEHWDHDSDPTTECETCLSCRVDDGGVELNKCSSTENSVCAPPVPEASWDPEANPTVVEVFVAAEFAVVHAGEVGAVDCEGGTLTRTGADKNTNFFAEFEVDNAVDAVEFEVVACHPSNGAWQLSRSTFRVPIRAKPQASATAEITLTLKDGELDPKDKEAIRESVAATAGASPGDVHLTEVTDNADGTVTIQVEVRLGGDASQAQIDSVTKTLTEGSTLKDNLVQRDVVDANSSVSAVAGQATRGAAGQIESDANARLQGGAGIGIGVAIGMVIMGCVGGLAYMNMKKKSAVAPAS